MTEKRTGQVLANKAGETAGFSIRPATGLKVVVRNDATGSQRTVPLGASGREYDNQVKKLKQIGWTEELWAASLEEKRQERIERSAQEEADVLKALQEREADQPPTPSAPGLDKVLNDMLVEALTSTSVIKHRLQNLHRDTLDGKVVKGEAAMDLMVLQAAQFGHLVAVMDELRRRGLVDRSMR